MSDQHVVLHVLTKLFLRNTVVTDLIISISMVFFFWISRCLIHIELVVYETVGFLTNVKLAANYITIYRG